MFSIGGGGTRNTHTASTAMNGDATAAVSRRRGPTQAMK
jgi:hypothetical protein